MSGSRQLRFPSTPTGATGTGRGTPGVDLPDGVVPIRCDEPGSFAWSVFNERHRALVDRLSATHATDQIGMEALYTLLEESTTGVVAPR